MNLTHVMNSAVCAVGALTGYSLVKVLGLWGLLLCPVAGIAIGWAGYVLHEKISRTFERKE